MTEAEWLECDDPTAMCQHAFKSTRSQRLPSPHRKVRLFSCACCRLVWSLLTDERSRQLVEISERFADGEAKKSELARADRAGAEVAVALKLPREPRGLVAKGKHPPQLAAEMAVWAGHDSNQDVIEMTAITAEQLIKALKKLNDLTLIESLKSRAGLFRDIFNPFHPVALNPSWLNATVVSLAKQMYDSRDFSAMPILADALQESGCDNETILQHCRNPGPHVRGCFVVDLLLGKG
jgi:hypothetical protein